MIQTGRFAFAASALLAMTATLQLAHALEDTVTLRKGNEKIPGRITQCDTDNISVQIKDRSGQTSTAVYTGPEVADLEWDGDSDFRSAEAAFKSGNYGSAARTFRSMKGDKENWDALRAEVKPFITYAYAECLYRLGKPDEAVGEFDKFMSDNGKSYYVPVALASMIDAVIQKGDPPTKITKLLDQLRGMGPEQHALADYYEGNMLRAQKKLKEAMGKYSSAAEASKLPETQAIALMGQAQCALEGGDLSKARDYAGSAVAKSSSPKVAGFAHLIAGNACMKEAEPLTGQKKVEKLTDAILEFMRNEAQYGGDPRTQPESMYKAGQCLEQLAKLFPDSHGGDRGRAVTLYSKLANDARFRGSQYANLANESLKALR